MFSLTITKIQIIPLYVLQKLCNFHDFAYGIMKDQKKTYSFFVVTDSIMKNKKIYICIYIYIYISNLMKLPPPPPSEGGGAGFIRLEIFVLFFYIVCHHTVSKNKNKKRYVVLVFHYTVCKIIKIASFLEDV